MRTGIAAKVAHRIRSRHLADSGAIVALALVLTACAFALLTGQPGHSGDTMQFQFLAEIHGVPHPPGAPVYSALVWLFRRLMPWASPAFAANTFSLLCGLFAVLSALKLAARWRVSPWLATCGLLALTTTSLWLRLSHVAELYVPALAAATAAMERTEAWVRGGRGRDLLAVGALLGFGAGIPPAVLNFGPACLLLALQRARSPWRLPAAWGALAALVAGLVASVALVVAFGSSDDTRYVWTPIVDAESAWSFVTAKQFRGNIGMPGIGALLGQRLPQYLDRTVVAAAWLLPVVITGLVSSLRSLRGLAVLAVLLSNFLYVAAYDVFDVWDFVLPGSLAVALWAGLGAAAWARHPAKTRGWLVAVLVVLAGAQLNALPGRVRLAAEQTHFFRFTTIATARLEAAGPGSVIVSSLWDDSCAMWYQVFVHGERYPDVDVAHAPDPGEVVAYVRGVRGLTLRHQNKVIPPGRGVFVIDDFLAASGLDSILAVDQAEAELNVVRAPDVPVSPPGTHRVAAAPGMDRTTIRYRDGWGGNENWGRWMLVEQARVALHHVPADAVLVVNASLWDGTQAPIQVEVKLDGQRVGGFVVDTIPWSAEAYRVDLGNAAPIEQAQLALAVDALHTARGDRPRALPVVSLTVESSPSVPPSPHRR